MSSFGDNNIKTAMQIGLDSISYDWYGKAICEMNAEEQIKFLGELFEVLHYLFGEW